MSDPTTTIAPDHTLTPGAMNDLLALSHVPRWAIIRHIQPQSVADHSFRTAIIAHFIAGRLKLPEDQVRPFNLLWLALTHDADEAVTGDISSPAKQLFRMVRDIPPNSLPTMPAVGFTIYEHDIVKLADVLEAYAFIQMNGQGQHSRLVASELGMKVRERAARLGINGAGIAEILFTEMGRFRG